MNNITCGITNSYFLFQRNWQINVVRQRIKWEERFGEWITIYRVVTSCNSPRKHDLTSETGNWFWLSLYLGDEKDETTPWLCLIVWLQGGPAESKQLVFLITVLIIKLPCLNFDMTFFIQKKFFWKMFEMYLSKNSAHFCASKNVSNFCAFLGDANIKSPNFIV